MTVCLLFFIPINHLTVVSSFVIAGGLFFFVTGFHLLARSRHLLTTPTSSVRSAALGPVEVNGVAAGPYTMPAPITGKECFLYRTTVWQQPTGKKHEWERVADETSHLPFFIDDSTGQLLIEPLGAGLELPRDFRAEYASSSSSLNLREIPPRVSGFLARHGIAPDRNLRIEECLIEPEDALFIAGTLTDNPGVPVRPLSQRSDPPPKAAPNSRPERSLAPEIIRLDSGAAPATIHEMSQQSKIAAALTRAGIAKPEAWAVAGTPNAPVAVEENAPSSPISSRDRECLSDAHLHENQPNPSAFDLTPPLVLMRGESNPTFVISCRSQKKLVSAVAWKSAALVCGGTVVTLLGLYSLLAQMALR